ncbi:MAG TPA: SRPBCC family protein [Pseudonocardia sp.]|jgi:hypothetical protein|nr:SRPBCC family protein [Pseudonocardia sp.]
MPEFEGRATAELAGRGVAEPGPVVRVALHRSATVPAAADGMWSLITDWAGMARWHLAPEDGGLTGPTLASCELVGAPHEVPRTRRMLLDNGAVIEEQLWYQDDGARRLYYTKSPDPSSVGYAATTYVDAVDDHTCSVHIAAQFDVPGGADASAAAARYEAVYAAMFRGFQRYFAAPEHSARPATRRGSELP